MSLREEDREDRTRRRAYLMWLDAGLPDGQSLTYWQAAEEAEAAEEAKSNTNGAGATAGETFPASDPETTMPETTMPSGQTPHGAER